MIVDAHLHVWNPRTGDYGWLGPHVPVLNRRMGYEEIRPQLDAAGVGATVLVQAADTDGDTEAMLATAEAHPDVAGIVAYLPLHRAAEAQARLERLRSDRRIVGVRTLIHEQPDADWLLRPEVDAGLGVLERAGLPFDLVAMLHRHLELVPELVRRHPQLRIVIDHLAKPPVGRDDAGSWRALMSAAAEHPLVFAKVSGLYGAAGDDAAWTPALLQPFVDHALEAFGPERLMYGGDWPMSLLAGGYERVWQGLREVLAPLSAGEREAVYGGTATAFYGLDLAGVPAPASAAPDPAAPDPATPEETT